MREALLLREPGPGDLFGAIFTRCDGWSQEHTDEKLGVHRGNERRYESGKHWV